MKLDGSLCSLPRSCAFGLGIAALVCLSTSQIIGTSMALSIHKTATGGRIASVALLLPSWYSIDTYIIHYTYLYIYIQKIRLQLTGFDGSRTAVALIASWINEQGSVRSGVRPVGNRIEHEQRAAVRDRLDERRLLHSSRRRLCLLRCPRHASHACPRLCDGCGRRRTEGGWRKMRSAIERAWSCRGREEVSTLAAGNEQPGHD